MPYSQTIILIPSHSLEDFPTELGDKDAASVLNAFAVAWHPNLLVQTGELPLWHRADEPPDDLDGRLILIPTNCDDWLPAGWPKRAAADGATIISGLTERDEMIEAVLAALQQETVDGKEETQDNSSDVASLQPVDSDLVADFLALGFCYLQMELLSRHMHHWNDLDEVFLQREAEAAARAALAHDAEATRSHLQSCFESLAEARERFYPVDCYLIDLCLLIPRLADKHLDAMLTDLKPFNILVSGQDLEEIAQDKPDTIKLMREAWDRQTGDILGGEYEEVASPLVPLESALRDFRRGHDVFRRVLGRLPTTWARRRFGLSPQLPQVLNKFGYHSALHILLDDGTYPDNELSKIRWEGTDGTVLDAITRFPIAAEGASSYLRLPQRLSESMEEDQTAALVFARWPEIKSPFFEDLRRMHQFSPVLGRFVTFDDYFQHTDNPGRMTSFEQREYLSPFLLQAVAKREPNPVSRFRDHFLRRAQFDAASWYHKVAAALVGNHVDDTTLCSVEKIVEQAGPDASTEELDAEDVQRQLDELHAANVQSLSKIILQSAGKGSGYLVLNPLSFNRRVVVDLPDAANPPVTEGLIKAVQFDEHRKSAVVDVPGSGFAWIAIPDEATPPKVSKVPIAEQGLLQNEFFQVHISETTGGLSQFKEHGRSPNRLSQQLAFRFPNEQTLEVNKGGEGEEPEESRTYYSEMRCHSLEVTSDGPAMGEIVTTGDLVDQQNDQRLAGFRQVFRVWRGKPTLEIEIEIDVATKPEGNPWTSYYGCRFAWNDSTASLTQSVSHSALPADGDRIESPYFLEIANEQQRTTILFEGLAFHRKTGDRMLDSVLVTEGEEKRKFRFVVAFDQNYPMQEALNGLVPVSVVPATGPPRAGNTGWFFHVNTPRVQITRVLDLMNEPPVNSEPWEQYDVPDSPEGPGFGLRLVETEGRQVSVELRCFQTPSRARQRDFHGRTLNELTIENDCVKIEMTAHEIADIELYFESSEEKTHDRHD